jgi:hypothetical protein
MAKAQEQHNQSIQDNLSQLTTITEEMVARMRAQDVSDQMKEMSIKGAIELYERKRAALVAQLK